jgi:uncharacterized protein (DUF2267 family)
MSYERFVEEVQHRSGFAHPSVARRAICATLAVLGERLRDVDRRAVAEQLPVELAAAITESAAAPCTLPVDADLDAFMRHLEVHSSAKIDVAQLRAVCQVLAETLDEQARAQLRIQPLNQLFAATLH